MTGSDDETLEKMCLRRMRGVRTPTTRAESTYGSTLTAIVALRMTRKYCGMNTTVIEIAAAMMPPNALLLPPESTIATTIASSSDGNAYNASMISTRMRSSQPPR